MVEALNHRFASVACMKQHARRRIPAFAFDYVEGGCNQEVALGKNRQALDAVELRPDYLSPGVKPDLTTTILGKSYAAPFAVAPLGLTGIVWPRASEMHARAAKAANIPYLLSTLSTTSIETAAACAEDNFWFQFYPPADLNIRVDLLQRAQAVGCEHLVVTVDVPAAGQRPRDIRNGLSIPPRISASNLWQSAQRPLWVIATAQAGLPQFASLQPYMAELSNIQDVANYVRTTLKDVVDEEMLLSLRDQWPGKLIVKGINHVDDARRAAEIGADALIVSNHGGRQLDAAASPVTSLRAIKQAVSPSLEVMADSGVESGVDIARYMALGAQMVFAGRAFMWGVAAHPKQGAQHTIDLLRQELQQVLTQLHCPRPSRLVQHYIGESAAAT